MFAQRSFARALQRPLAAASSTTAAAGPATRAAAAAAFSSSAPASDTLPRATTINLQWDRAWEQLVASAHAGPSS
ncbi:hypothetical protein CF336_g9461 [Tilletia laevis]|uniref:Uncharacterized protein n=1 Tax=Tilletia caries TaxID=13290 RepID=A0A8T8S9X3_9BASI|nr:hypothetical protein CF336_g9461 [Tilletia laevis]KAE8235814.1 hypothetical protein A4X03_0g9646 [Tilletia caries]